jgi:hypothetical protein
MLYVHVLARLNEDVLVLDTMREDVDTMLDVCYDHGLRDRPVNAMRVLLEHVEDHLIEKRERKLARIYGYERSRELIRR